MSAQDSPLVNRVAQSGIVTLNLEQWYPPEPVVGFDMKDYLFQGLILREKDFREQLKNHNWDTYQSAHLAVFCSADAIIPVWAYMLVTAYATPVAASVTLATPDEFVRMYFEGQLSRFDPSPYVGQRVVLKGCSDKPVPPGAYVALTRILQPVVQSLMYGEPCSTVPVFKRPRLLQRSDPQ
jgi:hypothetical protein